ncbi:MAG TPA: hypothetical protein VKT75_18050 [Acidobacteriaceae bacterium]|nr:hypothetical protein [Acidobacteriaceae bacterium]
MGTSHRKLVLLACGVIATGVLAQSNGSAPHETPAEDQSFYQGRPVVHPERLSGVWEASDGEGGVVGIQLELATTLPGDADPPIWTPQDWEHLELGVFQRKGPDLTFGEASWFSDSRRGGGLTFNDARLQLHSLPTPNYLPSIDLDLVEERDGCWHGQFHRGAFNSVVALCRPSPGPDVARSPLVGTWFEAPMTCIHIAQTGRGTFIGWTDALMIPGNVRFATSIPAPHMLFERFGFLQKVERSDTGEVSVVFGAYSGGCCSHEFDGKLSADGSKIQGNHFSRPATLTKMRGDSCVDSAALRRR